MSCSTAAQRSTRRISGTVCSSRPRWLGGLLACEGFPFIGGLGNFAQAGQEREHVPFPFSEHVANGARNGQWHRGIAAPLAVANFNGKRAAFAIHNWASAKVDGYRRG